MQVSRNKSKYTGFKRLVYSAKYALDGLAYAYKNEKSLRIHAVLSVIEIVLGFIFNVSHMQWALILASLAIILAFELLNTGLEACVDMVTLEYNELARIAKDCGSAATFVMSCTGLVIAMIIFLPKMFPSLF